MAKNVKLGSKVKDKVTGFIGIAVGATEYLQGCRRIGIQSQTLHDGKTIDAHWFDEPQLIVIKEGVITGPDDDDDNGGPAYLVPPKNRV